MAQVISFEIYAVDLPFRRPFKHACALRSSSESIFVKCTTDQGTVGYGESLARKYVTGETRDGAYELLRDRILPHLIGKSFDSLKDVEAFLQECDGKAPPDWVPSRVPQTAAWSAVDLALLDTFGREFKTPVMEGKIPEHLRYSGVVSLDKGLGLALSALILRLYGIRQVKLKLDHQSGGGDLQILRRVLGQRPLIRVDVNMAWTKDQALEVMNRLTQYGVHSFEQPLPAEELDHSAELIQKTGLGVIADESFNDRDSLKRLIDKKACTGVNVRISKCGGLIASLSRCREALLAGLQVQVGCQVGESSLLSAAHLALLSRVPDVAHAEGCLGLYLLKEDPARPVLQFGYGGRPPKRPEGFGLGVEIEEAVLKRWTVRQDSIGKRPERQGGMDSCLS